MPERNYDEPELVSEPAISDRTEERDDLLAKLARKKELDPILREIQKYRRQMALEPREWTQEVNLYT